MTRNVECRCDNTLTCGYCLRNAPPYFFTTSGGLALPPPADIAAGRVPGATDQQIRDAEDRYAND